MHRLDPQKLFEQLAKEIPGELHPHLFVTGSLAAAYHYHAALLGRGVNTKDADLVVHPAGHIDSCKQMAKRLKELGWRNTKECYAQKTADPAEDLRAIRLYPPNSQEYFIEFLNIPDQDQVESKRWTPVRLKEGWYGLPSFRFLGIAAKNRLRSETGMEYAAPAMMALANLLSHTEIGTTRIESGDMLGTLRSAKDLGRVIALARLEGREGTEAWFSPWKEAIKDCFPKHWPKLIQTLGVGLEELLSDANVLEEARRTTEIGLLNGMNVSADMLRATGERLMQDLIIPLRSEPR